ncbi:MAG: hypothetical protein SGI86_13265 [Deltaproteobacteria bacterium]|nr:hypothetical protein [Deltaproteobacteria bacterium]
MELPSDLIDLWAAFGDEHVEALLVGGQALALHGVPRFTNDADIWLRESPSNIKRALAALETFGAPQQTMAGLVSARNLDVVWMGHPPSRIDLMVNVPGGSFDLAWASRVAFFINGVKVECVNRDVLISLKRASGRPQDLLDCEMLSAHKPLGQANPPAR